MIALIYETDSDRGITSGKGFFTFSDREKIETEAEEKEKEIEKLRSRLGFHNVSRSQLANHVFSTVIQRISWIDWGIQKWYDLDGHFQYLIDYRKLMELINGKLFIISLIQEHSSFSEKAEKEFRAFCERKEQLCY